MRIIAGDYGGRQLTAPKGHRTHPMSDKVRGALFAVLGDVGGLSVLDAFAGSGAVGLEALSHGADHVVAVEIDKQAHQTIQQNCRQLGVGPEFKAVRANVSSWSDNNPNALFDIIICDPPYDQLQPALLQKLTRHLSDRGILVVSWPGGQPVPDFDGCQLIKQHDYGDAQLAFYRQIS